MAGSTSRAFTYGGFLEKSTRRSDRGPFRHALRRGLRATAAGRQREQGDEQRVAGTAQRLIAKNTRMLRAQRN